MNEETKFKALRLDAAVKACGHTFFERIRALRAIFWFSLSDAKLITLQTDDGRNLTQAERDAELVKAFENSEY